MAEYSRNEAWRQLFIEQGWLNEEGLILMPDKVVSLRFRDGGAHPLADFKRATDAFIIFEHRSTVEYYLWEDIRNVVISE